MFVSARAHFLIPSQYSFWHGFAALVPSGSRRIFAPLVWVSFMSQEMRWPTLDICGETPCHMDTVHYLQLLQFKVTSANASQTQDWFEEDLATGTLVGGTLLFASVLLLLPILVRQLGGLPAENLPAEPQQDAAPPLALLRVTGALCIGVRCSVAQLKPRSTPA